MNLYLAGPIFAIIATTQMAVAEEGFYYGVTLGSASTKSFNDQGIGKIGIGKDPSGTSDMAAILGGSMGYGFSLQNGSTIAIEGNLDWMPGSRMSYDSGEDSCISISPDWCEVDGIVRIRGVYSKPLSNGYDILSMAGIAAVTGPAEDGLGTYVSTTSTGYTLGVGSQKDYDFGTVRFEITYDKFDNPSPSVYSKTLEVVSLRSTYMF